MDKRYQIFVSSTYADLKEERLHVIQALMEMDCIPAGMELFPAADEEQWDFIKRVISDCDYYLVIIGGRYGSTTSEGISYTEKEYDFAVESGLKVIALLHENPDLISVGRSDIDPSLRERLKLFREKLKTGRLVKFWSKPEDLPGQVALSLQKTIKMFPAVGWVRANTVANEELLAQLNDLRNENQKLLKTLSELQQQPKQTVEGLAALGETFNVRLSYSEPRYGKRNWTCSQTWREIFAIISPYLMQTPTNDYISNVFRLAVKAKGKTLGILNDDASGTALDDQDFRTIMLQLKALGLVNISHLPTTTGGKALFWSLTPQGERLMMELRTVRSKQQ